MKTYHMHTDIVRNSGMKPRPTSTEWRLSVKPAKFAWSVIGQSRSSAQTCLLLLFLSGKKL